MLKIYFGNMEEAVYATSVYFDNTYEDSWITSEFGRQVINDIDKSEVIGANCIQSPILGAIPPVLISGGTKTLLLINFDTEHIFNASTCGDNCARWILDISRKKDITINLGHIMHFELTENDKVFILNTNETVNNTNELIEKAIELLR